MNNYRKYIIVEKKLWHGTDTFSSTKNYPKNVNLFRLLKIRPRQSTHMHIVTREAVRIFITNVIKVLCVLCICVP